MTATKIRFCWITAQIDRTEHAVTDEAQVRRTSMLNALCGLVFLPACMDIGPEQRCAACAAFLRARTAMRAGRRGRGRHAA